MDIEDSDPFDELRLLAAKHALRLLQSWQVPPIADQLLAKGIYATALAELAAIKAPSWSLVTPLIQKAMAELHVPIPSKIEAAWHLAHHCIRRIASGQEQPFEPLSLLNDVHDASVDVLPDKSYVGDALDVGNLIGIFWSYSAPNENYYEPEKRFINDESERQAILDRLAREESNVWLTRYS